MKKVEIIKNCPSCDSLLDRVNDQLFCRNTKCSATRNKKVVGFVKALKIKGLGEKTIEKLEIEEIADIYNLSLDFITEKIGEKLAIKLYDEIQKSKVTSLEKVLPGFSIPLIGSVASKKLNSIVNHIDEITFETCEQAGLGTKATENLIEWIEYEYPHYKNLPLFFENKASSKPPQSKHIKVCITGKLSDYRSRELASTFLESKGIQVVSGVSKTLDYLICEDNKPSSKLSKATTYNIPVVSINQLLEEINK